VSEQHKRDLLAAVDIFAMPSRTDSFGIVYLEAWLYGKPVIGARVWGVSDVIRDGENGLLVPFADVPDLERALRLLLDQPDLAASMGARGCRWACQEHSWDAKYPLIRQRYLDLVASRG